MRKGSVNFVGKSGERYHFQAWSLEARFKSIAAVYFVTKRAYDNGTYHRASHDGIYIGQTEDLSGALAAELVKLKVRVIVAEFTPAVRAAQPALEALDGPGGQVRGVGYQHRAMRGEPGVGEVALLHDVVLEVAAGQQDARGGGREVGVFTLEPGAGAPPGVGERVGLSASRRLGRVGVAARPAEQDGDVVTPGAHPVRHRLARAGEGVHSPAACAPARRPKTAPDMRPVPPG